MKNFVLRSIGVIGALSFFGLFSACSGDTENVLPPVPGTGGTGGSGGDGGAQCATITFDSPKTGASLGPADDKDKDGCANGFQYDVAVSTSADDGALAKLYANNNLVTSAPVSGGKAVFTGVSLDSNGTTLLKVQIGAQSCYETATVKVSCGGVTCSISKPVISPTHPALNGVPASQGGDRASAAGNAYQVAFEVTTNAESGGTVSLEVDKKVDAVKAQVGANGKAVFAGVTLTPDGDHTVKATCTGLSGTTGTSGEAKYPVDTLAPNLTVSGVADDAVKTAADDVDTTVDGIQFEVCGATTSSDATDLPSSLGAAQNNFCIKAGSAQANCMPMMAGKACVKVDCNAMGSAAQTLTATVKDAAGNPKALPYANVKCQTANPTVVIVDPVSYDATSSSPVILNKSKDADPAVYGLQYTVTACTNAPVGSMATLQQKAPGLPSAPIGAEVTVSAAQASDSCPAGTTNVAKFAGVTLAESSELADGTLVEVTRLRADVVVAGTTFSSALHDEWVDTTAPGPYVLNVFDPVSNVYTSCGAIIQSLVEVTSKARVGSDQTIPVVARVQHEDSTIDTTSPVVASGIVEILGLVLKTGVNTLTIVGTEPSGNEGLSSPCLVTVGQPPALAFVTPIQSALFNAASLDADPVTPGLQVDVLLSTNDNAHDVTLTVQGQPAGSATPSGGQVTFSKVTLPEADAVQVKATQVGTNGTASPQITVRVDTHVPTGATAPASAVADRRAASAALTFNAPSDYDPLTSGTRAVAQYEMRYLEVATGGDCATAMTDATFAAATAINPGGAPANAGQAESRTVNSLTTGKSYCMGVRGRDTAQNRGPLTVFPIVEPAWKTQTIAKPSEGTDKFGLGVLGGVDVDGDGFDDLLVGGEPNSVWIYFGTATGLEANPKVRIIGPSGGLFGYGLHDLGNFDGSAEAPKALPEIGVAAPYLNGQGAMYVFSLPASVHGSSLVTLQIDATGNAVSGGIPAHFTLLPDGTAPFNGSTFGLFARNVGDFDGDSVDDMVISASSYDSGKGRAYLFRGRQAPATTTLVAPTTCEAELMSATASSFLGVALAPLGNSGLTSLGGPGGVAVGVSEAASGAGQLHALVGRTIPLGAHEVWDVAQEAALTVTGAPGARLGGFLSFAGDVDGDGFDDLLAGNALTGASSSAYIVYGGSSWGAMAELSNNGGVSGESLTYRAAAPPLAKPALAHLNGDARADIAFSTYNYGAPLSSWVVNGRAKLTGTQAVSSVGVRPAIPQDAGFVTSMTLLPNAAGADAWPDVLIGDATALGVGRVIVLY